MTRKKQYVHPTMIVVKISDKVILMQSTGYHEGEPVSVRAHSGDLDWDEE